MEILFDDLLLVKEIKNRNIVFYTELNKVYLEVKDILNSRITYVFYDYTMHDINHSLRIIKYMGNLIYNIEILNDLELLLLIYSALLHDIGMAVSESDVELIKSDDFPHCDLKYSSFLKFHDGNEKLALQEYVRNIHSKLSSIYIKNNYRDRFFIPNRVNLTYFNELADIVESHTTDFDWITHNLKPYNVKGDFYFNAQYIAFILRIADILDIDSSRTPYKLFELIKPTGYGESEWRQHFIISNNDKIILNDKTNLKEVTFYGNSDNSTIHRKILNYIDWINIELSSAIALSKTMLSQYAMPFEKEVQVKIEADGYTFLDHKMTLDFKAVSSLLMGEKIYGSKKLGLRELIQNSIDACKLREELFEQKSLFGEDKFQPKVKVIIDEDKGLVVIKDNGVGMSLDIIKKHFLNIGISYYNSKDFLLKDFDYKPIGNYGIGFLACFMLSNTVRVITRHYESSNKYIIDLEKGNEYTSLIEENDVSFYGTQVELNYKDFFDVFSDKLDNICNFLESFFITDRISLEVIDRKNSKIVNIQNPLMYQGDQEKNFIIDINKYLPDFEGYVVIKHKIDFIKHIKDIDFDGDIYILDPNGSLKEIDSIDDLLISSYLVKNTLKYLSIPLVDTSVLSEYYKGMDYTNDDIGAVLDRFDRDLDWISIIVPVELYGSLKDTYLDVNEDIIDEYLKFDELVKLGHVKSCMTKVDIKEVNLFEGRLDELYMPFSINSNNYHRSSFSYDKSDFNHLIYIRGVWVKNFIFVNIFNSSVFEIVNICVNINSRRYIPDVSRNTFDYSTSTTISSHINVAIHLGAIELLPLNRDEKETINNFIQRFLK